MTVDSTDSNRGEACYNDDALTNYLNRADVQQALHVNITGLPAWGFCSNTVNSRYVQQNFDTTPIFKQILANMGNAGIRYLNFLIYNGDADTVCNFLGDQWFMESLAADLRMRYISGRQPWNFTLPDPSVK